MRYPGEGPRRQKLPLSDRLAANLSGPKVNAPERLRRDVARAAFEDYLQAPLEDLVQTGARDVGKHLAAYGQDPYDSGFAVGIYVDAILAVTYLD